MFGKFFGQKKQFNWSFHPIAPSKMISSANRGSPVPVITRFHLVGQLTNNGVTHIFKIIITVQ